MLEDLCKGLPEKIIKKKNIKIHKWIKYFGILGDYLFAMGTLSTLKTLLNSQSGVLWSERFCVMRLVSRPVGISTPFLSFACYMRKLWWKSRYVLKFHMRTLCEIVCRPVANWNFLNFVLPNGTRPLFRMNHFQKLEVLRNE